MNYLLPVSSLILMAWKQFWKILISFTSCMKIRKLLSFLILSEFPPLNQKRNYETIPIIIAQMNIQNCIIDTNSPRKKCPNTEFFSAPYFLVFGLNMEIYAVNIRIQFEYGRIRTRKTSVFGHFSHSKLVLITHLDTFHAVVV